MPDPTAASAPTAETPAGGGDAIEAYMADVGQDVLHRLNDDFADAVAMVGRILGERPDAIATRVVAIDGAGVDAIITDPEGDHEVRMAFATPVSDPLELTTALFDLITLARERGGDDETTKAEEEMATLNTLRTFLTEVVRVETINPHLVQVTFAGGDLIDFEPVGPDTFLYLLLPPPGRDELTIDQSFTWEGVPAMPEEDRPVGAYYTLRRWRPEVHELDILMVLHGDAGPASAWASRAAPGDAVALWGPRTAYDPPADTDWYLLAADETGLPAVAVILETLPDDAVVRVFAEVADASTRQELAVGPNVDVAWLHREGADAGTTSLLSDAVRAAELPDGRAYVWGGGESRSMTRIRRYARDELDLPKEAVSLVGYWRHRDDTSAA